MNFVELRLRVELSSGWVEMSRTLLVSGAPVAGHVFFIDPRLGSSVGVKVTRAGWLASRSRWVCCVEDEDDVQARLANDPVALVQHYLQRGWVVTGTP